MLLYLRRHIMNLTRYSTKSECPPECENQCWIISLGNEFSDMKTATSVLDVAVKRGLTANTIRISVFQKGSNQLLCYYVITP